MSIPMEISIERMTGQTLTQPPGVYPEHSPLQYWVCPHCKATYARRVDAEKAGKAHKKGAMQP